MNTASMLKGWVTDAGFVEVREEVLKLSLVVARMRVHH